MQCLRFAAGCGRAVLAILMWMVAISMMAIFTVAIPITVARTIAGDRGRVAVEGLFNVAERMAIQTIRLDDVARGIVRAA
jgi:hypothetical protein